MKFIRSGYWPKLLLAVIASISMQAARADEIERCLKRLDRAEAVTADLNSKPYRKIKQSFRAVLSQVYADDVIRYLREQKHLERAEEDLVNVHQKQRLERLEELRQSVKKNREQKDRYESRMGGRYQGNLCAKLDRFELDEEVGLKTARFTLFDDLDQSRSYSMSFAEFTGLRERLIQDSQKKCTALERASLTLCFLLPEKIKKNERVSGQFSSSQVGCFLPSYRGVDQFSHLHYPDFAWVPYIKRMSRSIRASSGACFLGMREIKTIGLKAPAKIVSFDREFKIRPNVPKLTSQTVVADFSGQARDAVTGDPIVGARLDLKTSERLSAPVNQNTDSTGRFTAKQVPAGLKNRSSMEFSKPRYHNQTVAVDRLDLLQETSDYVAELDPITLTVQGLGTNAATGEPIVSERLIARIRYQRPNGQFFEKNLTSESDSHGRYLLKHVPNQWNLLSLTPTTRAFEPVAERKVDLWGTGIDPSDPGKIVTENFSFKPRKTLISGVVSSSETGQPIPGMNVLIVDDLGREIIRTQTDAQGQYKLEDTAVPSRWKGRKFKVKVSDFDLVDPDIWDSSNYTHGQSTWTIVDDAKTVGRDPIDASNFAPKDGKILTHVSNPERNFRLRPRYVPVIVRVIHGRTGDRISDAEVTTHYRGRDFRISPIPNGEHRFEHVPAGKIRFDVKKEGYSSYYTTVEVKEQALYVDLILVPREYSDHRIVATLTWRSTPRDLDSQLFGGDKLLNFKTISNNTVKTYLRADLDRDDVTSYGPEVLVIQLNDQGHAIMDYKYMVYNYSQEIPLGREEVGAKVSVFRNGEFVAEWFSETGANRETGSQLWYVFAVENDQIVPRNSYEFSDLYKDIKIQLDRIKAIQEGKQKVFALLDQVDEIGGQIRKLRTEIGKLRLDLYTWTEDRKWLSPMVAEYVASQGWPNRLPPTEARRIKDELTSLKWMRDNYTRLSQADLIKRSEEAAKKATELQAERAAIPAGVSNKQTDELDQKISSAERAKKILETAAGQIDSENFNVDESIFNLEKEMRSALASVPAWSSNLSLWESKLASLEAIFADPNQKAKAQPQTDEEKKANLQMRASSLDAQIKDARRIIDEVEAKIVEKLRAFR